MRKLLMAVAVTLGLAALAHADCDSRTTTCLTNLDVSGSLTTGVCSCSNISTTTLTGATINVTTLNVATATVSGVQGLRMAQPSIVPGTTVPGAAYILGHDSNGLLYISTGTLSSQWYKVGAQ